MKRSARPIALVIAISLLIAGIAVGGTTAGAQTKPQKGGEITLIGFDVTSFNPSTAGNFSNVGASLYQVYGALVVEDPNNGEIKGIMLKSLTASPDATVWTLKVNPDIKFTDGTPYDAAAIKTNFEYMLNPANRSVALQMLQEAATMEVTDPLTLKVTLKEPDAAWGKNMVIRAPFIASPAAMAKYGAEYGTSVDKVVGAGPFVLKDWVRGNQLTYERNPGYWDAPRPYLDKVTIKVIPDEAAAYNTLLTKGADTWTPTTPNYIEQGVAAGMRVIPKSYQAVSYRGDYRFNLARPPFNDPLARKAVVTAVDPKKLAAAAGFPVRLNIAEEDNPWYNPKAMLPKYNAKKAQAMINEWSAKNGGAPLEFSIPVITGLATLGGGGEALQAVLSGYQNLKVNVVPVASSAANVTLGSSGNFDLHPSALGGNDPDISFRNALGSTGAQNYGKYSNPEMDAALTAGKNSTVEKDRKKAYDKVQELIVTDLPLWIMPFKGYTPDQTLVNNNALRDLEAGFMSNLQTDKVWVAKKK